MLRALPEWTAKSGDKISGVVFVNEKAYGVVKKRGSPPEVKEVAIAPPEGVVPIKDDKICCGISRSLMDYWLVRDDLNCFKPSKPGIPVNLMILGAELEVEGLRDGTGPLIVVGNEAAMKFAKNKHMLERRICFVDADYSVCATVCQTMCLKHAYHISKREPIDAELFMELCAGLLFWTDSFSTGTLCNKRVRVVQLEPNIGMVELKSLKFKAAKSLKVTSFSGFPGGKLTINGTEKNRDGDIVLEWPSLLQCKLTFLIDGEEFGVVLVDIRKTKLKAAYKVAGTKVADRVPTVVVEVSPHEKEADAVALEEEADSDVSDSEEPEELVGAIAAAAPPAEDSESEDQEIVDELELEAEENEGAETISKYTLNKVKHLRTFKRRHKDSVKKDFKELAADINTGKLEGETDLKYARRIHDLADKAVYLEKRHFGVNVYNENNFGLVTLRDIHEILSNIYADVPKPFIGKLLGRVTPKQRLREDLESVQTLIQFSDDAVYARMKHQYNKRAAEEMKTLLETYGKILGQELHKNMFDVMTRTVDDITAYYGKKEITAEDAKTLILRTSFTDHV